MEGLHILEKGGSLDSAVSDVFSGIATTKRSSPGRKRQADSTSDRGTEGG